MANDSDHIQQAVHNTQVLEYLVRKRAYSDWAATVAFYTALHVVEAVFFRDTRKIHRAHGHNHEEREAILKNVKSYQKIYRHYRQLQSASIIARYLHERHGASFHKYMSADQVLDVLIRHHLRQVIKSATGFLSKSTGNSLLAAFSSAFS